MRVPLLFWAAPFAAAAGYALARWVKPEPPSGAEPSRAIALAYERLPIGSPGPPMTLLGQRGSRAVPEIFAEVARAHPRDLRRRALSLLADPARRRDFGLWAPLLARWSELDGPGLMQFLRQEVSAADRPWLEGKAWYAWGAAHPQEAATAGKNLPPSLGRELMSGMAMTDPAGAAALARQMPDARMNLYEIAATVAGSAPEALSQILPREMYDRLRGPLQRAQAAAAAATDPAGAIALARRTSSLTYDAVPAAVRQVALHDPKKAAELVTQMPSSRTRALSAVSVARTWAEQDAAAAIAWTRRSLTGPSRECALLEIAATAGGPEPGTGLMLVEEAGWEATGNLPGPVSAGGEPQSEGLRRPGAVETAGMLIQQLAALDPAGAQQYLDGRVPEKFRAAVAAAAGLSIPQEEAP